MDVYDIRSRVKSIDKQDRLALVVQNRIDKCSQSGRCPGCWLQPANCVCSEWTRVSPRTTVFVHIQHCEWGVCSNTGITIHRTLENSKLLVRGLPEHDEQLAAAWEDRSRVPCVLWPDRCEGEGAVSVEELKKTIEPGAGLLLVVPDGTFGGARRMVNKYPPGCLKVSLSPESVLEGKPNSFLYPVRKYGGSEADTGRVSTLEAVAAFMREVGEDPAVSSALISNMKIQMDRALKQKQKPTIYGT